MTSQSSETGVITNYSHRYRSGRIDGDVFFHRKSCDRDVAVGDNVCFSLHTDERGIRSTFAVAATAEKLEAYQQKRQRQREHEKFVDAMLDVARIDPSQLESVRGTSLKKLYVMDHEGARQAVMMIKQLNLIQNRWSGQLLGGAKHENKSGGDSSAALPDRRHQQSV